MFIKTNWSVRSKGIFEWPKIQIFNLTCLNKNLNLIYFLKEVYMT